MTGFMHEKEFSRKTFLKGGGVLLVSAIRPRGPVRAEPGADLVAEGGLGWGQVEVHAVTLRPERQFCGASGNMWLMNTHRDESNPNESRRP